MVIDCDRLAHRLKDLRLLRRRELVELVLVFSAAPRNDIDKFYTDHRPSTTDYRPIPSIPKIPPNHGSDNNGHTAVGCYV